MAFTYPDRTKAIEDISFKVQGGEIFGFLGPNGAGKSTTIKILTTLLRKMSGSVTIGGYDIAEKAAHIRKIIGVQSQSTVVDPDLTGRENMILQGNLQEMRGRLLDERVDSLLEIVGLKEVAGKRASNYSGGMKKRLDLATILVHKPKILFLDEPTTGLDPQSRATIWDYLERLNKEDGITIFLTTQYLEEADRLCERLCIIDAGRIVAEGSPSDLKYQISEDAITITMCDHSGKYDEGVREFGRSVIATLPNVVEVINSYEGLTIYVKNWGLFVPDLVRAFDRANLKIVSISLSNPSLDDVFLKHTGRRIRVEEVLKQAPSGMWERGRRHS